MKISMRRMRARLLLIQGKVKLGLTFVLVIASIALADYYGGIFSIILEKDFETDFSYPLDVPDFRNLIENFKNGEAVDFEPINRLYAKPRFLEKADSGCDDFQQMTILVKSAPSNINKRKVIRSTWGNPDYLRNISDLLKSKKTTVRNNSHKKHTLPKSKNHEPTVLIKLVFLIGLISNHNYASMFDNVKTKDKPADLQNNLKDSLSTPSGIQQQLEEDIVEESSRHKDIVRIESIDSYANNTIKTMMGIRYLEEICPDFEHALLVDDDMYISIKNLITFLESPVRYPESDIDASGSETIGQMVDTNRLFAGKVLFRKPVRQRLGTKRI